MLRQITDEDITLAEQCLLPVGKSFDDERRDFIKCLETCDLQAVPGSGKTTVLLAKLLVLEQLMPFQDGSGILVISHTNTAVDEIKEKLQAHCPKLFSYPNFIGTIQSFVDEFLAIPLYLQAFKCKPVRIDNEIYEEKAAKFGLNYTAKTWLHRNPRQAEAIRKGLMFDENENLKLTIAGDTADFPIGRDSETYRELKRMKATLLKRGYLHFDDAYYLAEKYISKFPQVVTLLRKRFKYVFVDEMQDMEEHQFRLLEKLFFSGDQFPVYQRIGDRNQSIYSNDNSQAANWVTRQRVLSIRGSHRLSAHTARVVRPFGLYSDTEVIGSYESDLQPHLLVFEAANRGLVIERFTELVAQYQREGRFPIEPKHPIKAIGWVGKPSSGGNNAVIADYFTAFNSNTKASKIDHSNLLGYLLFYDRKSKTFAGIRTGILNAIVWVLREEGIMHGSRDFTKKAMIADLKRSGPLLADEFQINLYRWCRDCLKGDNLAVRQAIRDFLPDFLFRWKGHAELTQPSITFLESTEIGGAEAEELDINNIYSNNGVDVQVATIHSVKGQTHSATLYMETFFRSYETQKCLEQFCGTSATGLVQVTKREAAKILYVGLSRATELLCFAASSENVADHRQQFLDNGWLIIDVN